MLGTLVVPGPADAAEGATTIMEVQGDNHLSPMVGETVTTSGIVTAVAFSGFYMQDPTGDGDDNTSDGIFVFTGSNPGVTAGDEVEVTGTVSEFIGGGPDTGNLSITQISGDATVLSSGNPLPAPVEIGRRGRTAPSDVVISEDELPTNLQTDAAVFNPDVDAIDFYETMEGMYVEVVLPVATSATRQFNSFSSEFFALPSRGNTVTPRDALSDRGGILLQPDPDNTGDQNGDRIQIQFDGTIYPADPPAIKVGDRLRDIRGVVGYSFGNYEVNATQELSIPQGNTREERTSLRGSGNRVSVATYNVLNLSPDASDDAQRAKLAEQVVYNLRSPDVIALQEIQDNSGELNDGVTAADQTLTALVDAIAAAGGPTYSYFDFTPADGQFGGIPGGNIRNAFLYNADRVDMLDSVSLSPALLAQLGVENPDAWADSRSPLVGLFSFDGKPFTVVNVHNTSRFGSTPIFGGPQPFVQAGEQAREDQAAALNVFVDTILADNPDASVMIAGDFNTFEWTNDLADILPGEDDVVTNLLLTPSLSSTDRDDLYTFIFDGNSQALDHFFVTENLRPVVRSRVDIVHVNVDFPRLFSEVTASDHEPIVGRFRVPQSSGPTELPKLSGEALSLQVLHASDLEGGVEALDRATNFAAIVDSLEDSSDVDASVTISAGDNYIPGPFFGASGNGGLRDVFQALYQDFYDEPGLTNIREDGGRGDITIMNIIGFDASALGNHEFDAGTDAIASIAGQDVRGSTLGDVRWLGATFPYLSANLDFSQDGNLSGLFTSDLLDSTAFAATPAEAIAGANPPKIAPSTIINVDGGQQIGVVGATTQLLAQISSPGATSVIGGTGNNMPALAALLQPEIDALEAAGVNKIIVTSHLQQLALEEELATLLDGVDIIIAGGSDSLLANDDDNLRPGDAADRPYPVTATDAGGDPVAIVSTDGQYSYVGRLVVDFDSAGVLDLTGLDLALNGPVKTDDTEVEALWGSVAAATADGTKGGQVKTLVDAISGIVLASDGNVLGESSVFLDGRRSQVRTEETNFGDLSADANLAEAQAFDDSVVMSIKNGGGIRAAIGEIDSNGNLLPPPANPLAGKLAGQVSQLDLENSLRFNNGLSLLTLTAEELLAVVEHAVAATEPGATPGQFAQIGGARFEYDSSAAAGSRIQTLVLTDASGADSETIVAEGALVVDAASTYRIVTLNFLAGGGDGYPFDALAAGDRVDLTDVLTADGAATFTDAGSEQDALAEFLIANHGIGDGTPFAAAETPADQDTRIVDIAG
jgi:predicted extracellular nuclease/2',3'-cyclic-nucleotide 2'-phosphodiesterase (5'-nucleotidase family)